jgi:hypothetical protein
MDKQRLTKLMLRMQEGIHREDGTIILSAFDVVETLMHLSCEAIGCYPNIGEYQEEYTKKISTPVIPSLATPAEFCTMYGLDIGSAHMSNLLYAASFSNPAWLVKQGRKWYVQPKEALEYFNTAARCSPSKHKFYQEIRKAYEQYGTTKQ